MNKIKNIFLGAICGDRFICRNGKMAVYLTPWCQDCDRAIMFIAGTGMITVDLDGRRHEDCEDEHDIMRPAENNHTTTEFSKGAELILAERFRQVHEKGYTAEHDKQYGADELVKAAMAYLLDDASQWLWAPVTFKSADQKSNLIKAGAIIAAAIDIME